MHILRNEIIEAQKFRTDFLKWKLVISATIGGFGLGVFGAYDFVNSHILISLIPLACVYCDIQCYHINLRVAVLAEYLRCNGKVEENKYRDYEYFSLECARQGAFDFEDYSLRISTVIVCAMVIAIGVLDVAGIETIRRFSLTAAKSWPPCNLFGACKPVSPRDLTGLLSVGSGMLGIWAIGELKAQYLGKRKQVEAVGVSERKRMEVGFW